MNMLAVGAGGCLGALLRYGLNTWVLRHWQHAFPLGTMLINTAGCLLLGALAWNFEHRAHFGAQAQVFLRIGLLGSFTTFSTFGLESFELMKNEQWLAALVNILFSVCLGLAAVAAGWMLSKSLFA